MLQVDVCVGHIMTFPVMLMVIERAPPPYLFCIVHLIVMFSKIMMGLMHKMCLKLLVQMHKILQACCGDLTRRGRPWKKGEAKEFCDG